MSEDVTTVVDETPPPDIVDRPARSSGAYKLCMECGQNVLRPHFRAGSSICKPCEAQAQGPVVSVEVASVEVASVEVAAAPVERGPAPDVAPVPCDAAALLAAVPAGETVHGSAEAYAWLTGLCGEGGAVTLDGIAAYLRQLREREVQMIGRVTRGRPLMGDLRPEDVPLETAALALYAACDDILKDALRAAMELLGLSLNQVMLGNLAFSRQELLNQDQSLVPQASLAVQYGTGRGVLTQGGRGLMSLPGGRLVDAAGQLVKTCLCCGREFHPPRDRPNPDFCDDQCGTFVDQLRLWATNTVLDELRYPGSATPAPLPDPRTFWQVERCQEPYLHAALAFRETRVAQQMEAARVQQTKMRGL